MGITTGAQYLERLRDGREVWIDGERVQDVTTHPAFRNTARTIAHLYDMQHDPAYRDVLTVPGPNGDRIGTSFILPRSVEDLVRRREMVYTWAKATCGMMGRSPDFLNVNLAAYAAAKDYFAAVDPRFGDNVVRYWEYARDNDLCLTHTLINPQANRSKGVHEQADPFLAAGVVTERDDGLVIRGARMLATLAPYSDELAVFPSTFLQNAPEAVKYSFAFAIPTATPGLKFICRESFDLGRSPFDHPLGSRFEEMDAVVVFDDVLVPWERVFLYGSVQAANGLFRDTHAMPHLIHQFGTKEIAKTEFILGVAMLMSETIAVEGFPHVQEKLAEIINYVEIVHGLIRAAEADATPGPGGTVVPAAEPLNALRNFYPVVYPRLIEILQLLGASGLMATPTERDVRGPLAGDINRYFQAARADAPDRIQLFRLAWDIACSSFGSRQVLYERFFSGDPVRLLQARYQAYPRKDELKDRVQQFLTQAETQVTSHESGVASPGSRA